jgi:hypothetical protein
MITVLGFTMAIILALLVGVGAGYFLFGCLFANAVASKNGRCAIFKQLHEDYPEDFHAACNCEFHALQDL